jgi:hypothetical protein
MKKWAYPSDPVFVTQRTALAVACLGWACYVASLFMRALIHDGGELIRGTWTGWDALTRGGLVWAVPFIGGPGLNVVLISFWLGVLWLTNVLVLLSPALSLPTWTKSRRVLRRTLPVAAAADFTFFLAPDVQPAVGYYFWLASFVLLSMAAIAWTLHETSPEPTT